VPADEIYLVSNSLGTTSTPTTTPRRQFTTHPRQPGPTMNVLLPSRLRPLTAVPQGLALVAKPQARSLSFFGFGGGSKTTTNDSTSRSITDLLKQSPKVSLAQQIPVRGALDESSIFGAEEADAPQSSKEIDLTANRLLRDPNRHQWGWLKKSAARDLRRRGRLTRQERIAQTEREHTAASHFIKTSVKKLAPLARQIVGKNVHDAVLQMRFSPKKAAKEVLAHLHHTRNEAVVRKGMKAEEMYIAQAWVGRGPFDKGLNHRARGKIDMLKLPYTSKSSGSSRGATSV